MERPSTIYDIAREANVSSSTVSRAFTRPERINPATVAAVLTVAKRLGYQPNKTARSLSTGRAGNLAIVVPNISNPFFTDLTRAFNAAAHEQGYSVFLIDSNESAALELASLARLATQIDGVALIAPRTRDDELGKLFTTGNYVLVNRVARPGVPTVQIDSERALVAAFDDLAALGHRRVVYARGPVGGHSDKLRRRIARRLSLERGMQPVVTSAQGDDTATALAAIELLGSSGSTACFVHSDSAAIALLGQCRIRGIDVPRQVSVIGHDDIAVASVVYPALSTVDAKTRETGQCTANELIRLVAARQSGGVPGSSAQPAAARITVVADYVRRESTGPAPDR